MDMVNLKINGQPVSAPKGSTIPDNVPYMKDFVFDIPSARNGIDTIAPSGKF